ncbi:lymphocyte cytosolic protein 2a isoform X2 [Scleropages formosus]|uniref:Lymphocyte cytosolic protein 2a n=1 Tax=Scleropages formosus TaxID=113540 RepID=A0A8C9SM28_SCLFO|nr:lymphocyte cytosolic protein 2-like isoform X2 [Scleropages formosus]
MSSETIPSKSEVMGWNAPRLAEYMRKLDLGGCDKVIMKHSMNGPRFLNMSDNDLQKFPKIHAPYIAKICQEIKRKEEKKTGFFIRNKPPPKNWEPEPVQQDHGWDSEEFDQSDDNYESPDAEDDDADDGDYESPTEGDPNGGGFENDNDYEPPPSGPEEMVKQICPAKPMGESDYIDNTRNRVVSLKTAQNMPPTPPERPGSGPPPPTAARPGPPCPGPRRDQSPSKPFRAPNMPPTVDRTKKPGSVERILPGHPDRDLQLSGRKPGGVTDNPAPPRRPLPGEKTEMPRLPKPPLPGMVNRSSSSVGKFPSSPRPSLQESRNDLQDDGHMPRPGGGAVSNSNTFPLPSRGLSPRPGPAAHPYSSESVPSNIMGGGSLPSRLSEVLSGHRAPPQGPNRHTLPPPQPRQPPPMLPEPDPDDDQDLDPLWYVGQVTRGQAEGYLRAINQDGTYLVRDSSRRSSVQPYTLMVLYQDKVYNIQIRYNSEKDVFLLGTNTKNRETFMRVRDIIQFHTQVPLLLIEAKDRGAGPQKQCPLIYPVQYR